MSGVCKNRQNVHYKQCIYRCAVSWNAVQARLQFWANKIRTELLSVTGNQNVLLMTFPRHFLLPSSLLFSFLLLLFSSSSSLSLSLSLSLNILSSTSQMHDFYAIAPAPPPPHLFIFFDDPTLQYCVSMWVCEYVNVHWYCCSVYIYKLNIKK